MDTQSPQTPPHDPRARQQAVSYLMVTLILLGISIFLMAAGRTSMLVILCTIAFGGYSAYLFYNIWRKR